VQAQFIGISLPHLPYKAAGSFPTFIGDTGSFGSPVQGRGGLFLPGPAGKWFAFVGRFHQAFSDVKFTHPFYRLLQSWLLLALGVLISAHVVPGIGYQSTATLIVVVLLLSFFNAILKPLLVLFTLPFIVLTMGLGLIVINALLFLLVGTLVEGFEVTGFGPALLGSLIISIINVSVNFLIYGKVERSGKGPGSGRGKKPDDDDVIDI